MWRRNESLSVHSQSRVQAPVAKVDLAYGRHSRRDPRIQRHETRSPRQPAAPTSRPATLTGRRSALRALKPPMEKFVIEGGVPLSGTIAPAGNKNARAADPRRLPADRRRGGAAQRAPDHRRRRDARPAGVAGRAVNWIERRQSSRSTPPTSRAPRSTASWPSRSGPRSCWPVRCWRASAARRCRRRAAT